MHRRLVVLTGTPETTAREADALAGDLSKEDVLRIASDADRATLRRVLGREVQIAIVDLHPGIDPDVLGAVHGTVRGGGLVVLRVSEEARSAIDERLAVWPYGAEDVGHRFRRRFFASLDGADEPGPVARRAQRQEEAVEAIASGQVVVLTAHRGRGKSAALGMAARWVAGEVDRVIVTGPSHAAVREVLRFAEGAPRVRFLPPEEAARSCTEHDALFVDEAAALPLPLLESLTRRTDRLAFATTVHGYEGTGRGFVLRFVETLRARHPELVEITLEEPIRYAAGDPVEAFVHRLLLIEPGDEAPRAAAIGADDCVHELLDRDRMASDEALLRSVFGLLVDAHYRTTPSDLWRLLDAPNLDVHVLRADQVIAAVAVVAREGGLDDARVQALAAGEERIRGHAIPESLVCHLGRPAAAALGVHRITRIAVAPDLRRRGLGSALLARVLSHARASGAHLGGSIFGTTVELLRFWQRAGFSTVRISASRSARSGEQSALVLAPLTADAEPLVNACARTFTDTFPHALSDTLRSVDPDLALVAASPGRRSGSLDATLESYAFAGRPYDAVVSELWALAADALRSGALARMPRAPARLIVMKVLQKREWEEVAEASGVTVPVAMRAVRSAVAQLLRSTAPT